MVQGTFCGAHNGTSTAHGWVNIKRRTCLFPRIVEWSQKTWSRNSDESLLGADCCGIWRDKSHHGHGTHARQIT